MYDMKTERSYLGEGTGEKQNKEDKLEQSIMIYMHANAIM